MQPIRAFFSSPYMSHNIGPEVAITDAMLGLLRLRHDFWPVLALADVPHATRNVVWSPLLEGDLLRAADPRHFTETRAREWCLEALKSGAFNALITCQTVPRKPGASSFCDAEAGVARQMGMRLISDIDVQMGSWNAR